MTTCEGKEGDCIGSQAKGGRYRYSENTSYLSTCVLPVLYTHVANNVYMMSIVRFESAVKKEHFGIHHPPEVCTVDLVLKLEKIIIFSFLLLEIENKKKIDEQTDYHSITVLVLVLVNVLHTYMLHECMKRYQCHT